MDPDDSSAETRGRLEVSKVHPDGTLASGLYARWHDDLYDAYQIGEELWISYRSNGQHPEGWRVKPGSWNEQSGMSSFARTVTQDEVQQYVNIQTWGMWRGFRFGLYEYHEDGMVSIRGSGGQDLLALINAGEAYGLETPDEGRDVYGRLPWDQITDIQEDVRPMPL